MFGVDILTGLAEQFGVIDTTYRCWKYHLFGRQEVAVELCFDMIIQDGWYPWINEA